MKLDISLSSPQALLTLLNMKGIGRVSAIRLVETFSTLEEIFEAPAPLLTTVIPKKTLEQIRDQGKWISAYDKASRTLDLANKLDVQILTFSMSNYPRLLKKIKDYPPIVYVKGNLRPTIRNVACVGTREPSVFGSEVADRLAQFLARNGWGIVSGLALGVDSIAHQAAIDVSGYTIAVMAGGLDKVYPAQNIELANNIIEADGVWLSEQPFGTPAIPRNLVQRDRLQSGMSVATIPMQTDVKGGTMHTVRFTLEQERRLYVPVPQGSHATEPKSQGLLALVENNGPQLAKLLNAKEKYAELLTKDYPNQPVATPIRGRGDYEKLLQELEDLVAKPGHPNSETTYTQTSF